MKQNWKSSGSRIADICLKTNQTLTALGRLAKLLSFHKKRLHFKTIFESQFKYYPLIGTFCCRSLNYLFENNGSFSIHHTIILIEICKVKSNKSENAF